MLAGLSVCVQHLYLLVSHVNEGLALVWGVFSISVSFAKSESSTLRFPKELSGDSSE